MSIELETTFLVRRNLFDKTFSVESELPLFEMAAEAAIRRILELVGPIEGYAKVQKYADECALLSIKN